MKFLVVGKNGVFVALFLDTIPGIVMLIFGIEKIAFTSWNTIDEVYSSHENVDKTETSRIFFLCTSAIPCYLKRTKNLGGITINALYQSRDAIREHHFFLML